jgi:hypothetical protein
MGTAKFDDGLPSNPKIIEAGATAAWLWLCSVLYCRRGLTDGFIPRVVVPTLAIGLKAPFTHAAKLVACGLWDQDGPNYRVHDFLDWNPSKAQVEGYRANDRERKQARHSKSDSSRNPNGIHPDSERIPSDHSLRVRAHAGGKSEYVSESESEKNALTEESARETTPDPSDLVLAWNTFTFAPIPRCLELNPKRRRLSIRALKARPISEWRQIIQRIEASPFCKGQSDRGWVANFDWLLQDGTAAKVLEGLYDARNGPRPESKSHIPDAAASRALLEATFGGDR